MKLDDSNHLTLINSNYSVATSSWATLFENLEYFFFETQSKSLILGVCLLLLLSLSVCLVIKLIFNCNKKFGISPRAIATSTMKRDSLNNAISYTSNKNKCKEIQANTINCYCARHCVLETKNDHNSISIALIIIGVDFTAPDVRRASQPKVTTTEKTSIEAVKFETSTY